MSDKAPIVQNFMPNDNLTVKRRKNIDVNTDEQRADFLATSPIHGFGFIFASRNRQYSFFWLSLMVIFLVLMTASLLQLILQYTKQQEVTSVNMNVNETMEMPPVTICASAPTGTKHYLLWHPYEPDSPYPGTPLNELLEFALNNTNKKRFLERWDDKNVTLQTALYYFRQMSKWQYSIGDQLVDIKTEHQKALKDDHQWKAAEMLEKFAIEHKISQQELFNKLGIELNKLYQLNATVRRFVDNETKTEQVTYQNGFPLTWVGEDKVCFLIQLPFKVGDPTDTLTIYLNVENTVVLSTPKPKNPILVSMDRKTKLRAVEDAQLKFLTSYLYGVSSHMISVFETTERCSFTKSQLWCHAECRQKLMEEKCGCRPLDYDIEFQRKYDEKIIGDVDMCWASQHFNNCKPYKGTDDRRCITKDCLPDCKVESQEIIQKGSKMLRVSGLFWAPYIQFNLSVGKFYYPTFKQLNVMEWQNFVADFGGLFGVYFGASFLSIVHVGEYLIRKTIRYRNERIVEKCEVIDIKN